MGRVVVSGAFDELRSKDLRLLEEASKLGELTVWLWSDALVRRRLGRAPRFPEAERLYFLRAVRFVKHARLLDDTITEPALLADLATKPEILAAAAPGASPQEKHLCDAAGVEFRLISDRQLQGWPYSAPAPGSSTSGRKKVVVTGCYDWFHSGHIRFFEEVGALGDLYAVVGHDANIRLLKGAGHPMFSQDERRYMVGCVRHVTEALISSGHGWLDAESEIERLKPDIYAVNEDGDRGGKREFCEQRGIEYRVFKRTPAPGLPPRTSTNLRGF